jgi:hypothetical protein
MRFTHGWLAADVILKLPPTRPYAAHKPPQLRAYSKEGLKLMLLVNIYLYIYINSVHHQQQKAVVYISNCVSCVRFSRKCIFTQKGEET